MIRIHVVFPYTFRIKVQISQSQAGPEISRYKYLGEIANEKKERPEGVAASSDSLELLWSAACCAESLRANF